MNTETKNHIIMSYKRNVYAGGFSKTIELIHNITDEKCIITYCNHNMGGENEFTLKGNVNPFKGENKNYFLIEITHHNDISLTNSAYFDLYILDNKNVTDDCTGLTEIRCANSPSYNMYFNCVVYLNYNILWEPFVEENILKDLNCLNNAKLINYESEERYGWDWIYDEDTGKICTKHGKKN